MKTLEIDMENCFGISKFEHKFDFADDTCVLIYAPNGMMKSSFARTFECISKDDKKSVPCDRIYPQRKTNCTVKCDGKSIDPKSIFVANAESDIATDNRITTFLASKELKERYDSIYQELDKVKNDFLAKLKSISKSTDCESEVVSTFRTGETDTLFSCLLSIEEDIRKARYFYDFRYNDVFDKKGNVKKFLDKHKDLIQQYFTDYQKLLSRSRFFKTNREGVSFGTYQATVLRESVADEAFFAAKHRIKLSSGVEITSAGQLQEIINAEIKKVISDDKLKSTFEKIDKAIGNNSELRAFKAVLEKDNTIIPLLMDYNEFKKQVWYGFIHRLCDDAIALINFYKTKTEILNDLIAKAQQESRTWETIIDIYNKRFSVPFTVEIKNKADVILKQDTANLIFKYKDERAEEPIEQPKETLLKILSRGECRAFYTLQILFEIEARKHYAEDSLLILDDIADSFDYKNKYAIIEYLADVCKDNRFKIILLTHNFDFYRTVASRLGLKKSVFMAIHDTSGDIKCKIGQYRKDVFQHFSKRANKKRVFIGLLPFVRNIIEYSKGEQSDEYKCLTNCLHIKAGSGTISSDTICRLYKTYIHNCQNLVIDFGATLITDLILQEADVIVNENPLIDEILLENKLVLSIAIRLRAEQLILKLINDIDTDEILSNQTRELIDKYKQSDAPNPEILSIFDKVSLMTPENIHVNAFMYEPLIDMSVMHLIKLYNDIKCHMAD